MVHLAGCGIGHGRGIGLRRQPAWGPTLSGPDKLACPTGRLSIGQPGEDWNDPDGGLRCRGWSRAEGRLTRSV